MIDGDESECVEGNMDYKIRRIKENEIGVLEDFLYEAIFIPEGVEPPAKEIIHQPELQVYISDFGKSKGDIGLVAEIDDEIVGAVWVRIMNDYGHIDNDTPSFAISLYKEYRNIGIGTAMIKEMLTLLKENSYKRASLAVQKANYAVEMYKKVGFEIADENDEEYIMVCHL
jgi:ribosomal protein S18 acetylase RimI-like enzyme